MVYGVELSLLIFFYFEIGFWCQRDSRDMDREAFNPNLEIVSFMLSEKFQNG